MNKVTVSVCAKAIHVLVQCVHHEMHEVCNM